MGRKTVYNKLVNESSWELVSKDNKDLLKEFLDYKKGANKSPETLYQYESMLKIFFVWVMQNAKNKHYTDVTKRDYIKYQNFLVTDCGHSPKRVRTMRSAISSLGIFVENVLDEDYPNFRNIINKLEAPKSSTVREKTVVTFEDVVEVCDKLYDEKRYMLSAYLSVAVFSGLRKQELTRLLYKDFTENKKIVYGSFYKTSPIKLKGDIHKKESKLIWNRCDKYLNKYLEEREGIECDYLFYRKEKDGSCEQMKVSTANSWMRTINRYFEGVTLYTHALRHTIVTELTKSGVPIEIAQVLMSHSSSAVTEIYNDNDKEDSLGAFSDFFSGNVDKVETKKLNDL